ncbi:MAG: hypothetical protein HYY17_14270 [Planctomycetes bacterium]|nr:hypothetical protein [Planctomycetota bacterium]
MDLGPLFKALDAQPFRPIRIALLNGERVRVDHPESITFQPGRHRVVLIHVTFAPGDDFTFFWPDAIAAVHVLGKDGDGNGP